MRSGLCTNRRSQSTPTTRRQSLALLPHIFASCYLSARGRRAGRRLAAAGTGAGASPGKPTAFVLVFRCGANAEIGGFCVLKKICLQGYGADDDPDLRNVWAIRFGEWLRIEAIKFPLSYENSTAGYVCFRRVSLGIIFLFSS